MRKMRHAQFRIEQATSEKLVLGDMGPWDKYMTITNDAEYVVEQVASMLGNRKLFYYDSANILTEIILYRGNKFSGFKWVEAIKE